MARTKIAFSSDRAGDRMKGPVADRGVTNIYYVDYDGANEKRVSIAKTLEIAPVIAPDGRSIAYVRQSADIMTDRARRSERAWLSVSEPTSSVWPSTRTPVISGFARSTADT